MDSLLRTKATIIITTLKEDDHMNILKLSYYSKITYSHVFKLVKYWVGKGLLELERNGREQKVSLTLNGLKVRKHLLAIESLLNK